LFCLPLSEGTGRVGELVRRWVGEKGMSHCKERSDEAISFRQGKCGVRTGIKMVQSELFVNNWCLYFQGDGPVWLTQSAYDNKGGING
jgi:hypothetical protein